MSAEILRRAASLMRERANAATSIYSEPHPKAGQAVEWFGPADMYDFDDHDGPHIASWHPVVALAVADLFDTTAKWVERDERAGAEPRLTETDRATIAAANAYLGESA